MSDDDEPPEVEPLLWVALAAIAFLGALIIFGQPLADLLMGE